MPDLPKQLTPGPRLAALIRACQKVCVPECCGIDAFDFSPLHTASHLSAHTGAIAREDLSAIEHELDELLESVASCEPNADGFVCSLEYTNQCFSASSLAELVARIKSSLVLAPKVLEFANSLSEGEP